LERGRGEEGWNREAQQIPKGSHPHLSSPIEGEGEINSLKSLKDQAGKSFFISANRIRWDVLESGFE